jgi:hypothetical protein
MVTKLLIAYRSAFTLRRAPYLISYITYVAATIHVRVLAADQSSHDPAFRESRQALRVCLDALEENAKTNAGTSKARSIIQGLMAQIGVQVPQEDTSMVPTDLFGKYHTRTDVTPLRLTSFFLQRRRPSMKQTWK